MSATTKPATKSATKWPPHVRITREPCAYPYPAPQMLRCSDVAAYAAQILRQEETEQLVVIHLNQRKAVISWSRVSSGTANASLAHPREIFRSAIAAGATGIVLAHNHPSGDPTPSPEDRKVTSEIRAAGELLGIELLDHVIVGHSVHYSFTTEGTFQ